MRRTIATAATVTDIMIATAVAVGTVVMIAAAIMAGTVAVTMAGIAGTVAAGPSGAGTIASGFVAEPGPGRSISAPVILSC